MALWFELVLEEQENLGSISGLSKWVSHPRHKVVVKKLRTCQFKNVWCQCTQIKIIKNFVSRTAWSPNRLK